MPSHLYANPSCVRCSYFQAAAGSSINGTCQRFPPLTLLSSAFLWPTVLNTDWCGEYEEL